MKLRLFAVALLACMPVVAVSALSASHASAATTAKVNANAISGHVTGKFTGSKGDLKGPGTFAGTMSLTHVFAQGNRLMARATLTGTLTDKNGATKSVTNNVTVQVKGILGGKQPAAAAFIQPMPMSSLGLHPMAPTTCTILTLDLGPLHLNLLGLVVDLNAVHLTITGQTGSGNLLGNLLCGIAGLLNGVSLNNLVNLILGDIATLLNQILTL